MPEHAVLVTGQTFQRVPGDHVARLEAAGCRVRSSPYVRGPSEAELLPLLADVEAVLAGTHPFTRRVFESAPRLRVVSRFGVGYDAIDVPAATEHGVWITTTPGTNELSVADHTIALLLGLARHLVPLANLTRAGQWERAIGIELSGAVLGLIGFGRIGRQVATRARACGMELLVYDVAPDAAAGAALGARFAPLDEVLATADFVSLHAPATTGTRGLINARTLALMKPTAYLINTARGDLVDEPALAAALRGGRLAGAGLDVFAQEPPDEANPLLALPNVLATPHIAGITEQSAQRMARLAVENILAVLEGGRPPYPVNEPRRR
ncbi:MAG TPA: phosphoglycerate dehydrogenase [Chloroflexota bacterium]|nr:phosphoglycerate dehydrogenase [Chloroflexota bacterium]